MNYLQDFKGGLIVVLFELNVDPQYYQNWLERLKKYFPNVVVIVK